MRPLKIKKMLSSTRLCCIIFRMIEIEIKAHAKNKNAIKSTLSTIGKYEGFVVRHDYYYRHHNCFSYPARIRIEKSDNGQKVFLTHKNKSLVKDKSGVVSEKNEEKEAEISEKAKEVLINLLNKEPESYKAHKLLAKIYESEGGMRKAIDEYVQAIDIDKKDYDSYFKVANLLNSLDKKDEASQMLTSLLSKKPDYKEASVLLGDLLIEKEMYKEAVNVYMEALKFNPLDFDINYSLGIAYTMVNDFQSAKEYYEKAAQINSFIHNSKYSLAEIALIYKEIEEAEKLFMESIDDEELAPDSYYELAKICLIKGDKERAIQYANIAIDLMPKKISEKIKKDSIFIPIMAKLSIPFNIEENEEEKEVKLSKKERKAKEHLEQMSEITRQIGYNDIQMFSQKNKSGFSNEEKDVENDIEKEIQE